MVKIKKSKNKDYSSGFTVVEMLVTIFVFSIMAMVTASIFVRALQVERKSFSAQVVQENILAVFERMSKEIRVSDIPGPNSDCTATSLNMTVYDSSGSPLAVTYQLNSVLGVVERVSGGVTYQVSSSDVIFNSLKFCILNSGIDDQPVRVTVLASISDRANQATSVNVQTTTISRNVANELQN